MSVERDLCEKTAEFLRRKLPNLEVRTEEGLYSGPFAHPETGVATWPRGGSGVSPWKQDICCGTGIENAEDGDFDFIPLVTIEAKARNYNTDVMMAAATKLRRLQATYPYLSSIYLMFITETELWGPTQKAFAHLRDFDAYVPVRYDEGSQELVENDLQRLLRVVEALVESARNRATLVAENYKMKGWLRRLEDLT